MHRRLLLAPATVALLATLPAPAPAQTRSRPTAPAAAPERAVRRDIPLTNMIRRAFAALTRDSTGRPGPRYWQLWTDYAIEARLDAPSGVVTRYQKRSSGSQVARTPERKTSGVVLYPMNLSACA